MKPARKQRLILIGLMVVGVSIASGMDDYISKPFRQSELVRALNV